MQKIKSDDEVIVIAGKDKGKRGNRTFKVLIRKSKVVIVVWCNMVSRSTRSQTQTWVSLVAFVEKECHSMQVSNVAIFNPETKKADRVGFKILEDGKKVRFFKSNGEVVDA